MDQINGRFAVISNVVTLKLRNSLPLNHNPYHNLTLITQTPTLNNDKNNNKTTTIIVSTITLIIVMLIVDMINYYQIKNNE